MMVQAELAQQEIRLKGINHQRHQELDDILWNKLESFMGMKHNHRSIGVATDFYTE